MKTHSVFLRFESVLLALFLFAPTTLLAVDEAHLAQTEAISLNALFFDIDPSLIIGSDEYKAVIQAKVSEKKTFAALCDWLKQCSDKADFRFGVNYVAGFIKITLQFDHPEGLLISQVEIEEQNNGDFSVKHTVMRLLKGTHIATEDIMNVSEIKIRE